jgi:hypothetical protein
MYLVTIAMTRCLAYQMRIIFEDLSITARLRAHIITMLILSSKGAGAMTDEYSLADVLERMYQNQLGIEAALMELVLVAEQQGLAEVGSNVRGALWGGGENAGHIKQGLAKLKGKNRNG